MNNIKKGLILFLFSVLLIPALVYASGMATVINPDTGDRVAIEIGSQFPDGYVLETSYGYKANDSDMMGTSVVSNYQTSLSSSMTSTQLTIPVSSIQTKDGHTLTMADLGSKVFFTIEPGGSKEEIVMCEDITGSTWSSCTRGLAFYGTSTAAVAANKNTHNSGSIVIMSNVHYVYDELVDKEDNETIAGEKTFTDDLTISSNLTVDGDGIYLTNGEITGLSTPLSTATSSAANVEYANNLINQGAATSTPATAGISKISTSAVDPDDPITVGDNDTRVPIQGENDALVGTSGTPSTANPYVTSEDVDVATTSDKIVRRKFNGQISVIETPASSTDAVSMSYADSLKPKVLTTLDQSLVSLDQTPTETTFYTESISGGLIGTNDVLRITGLVRIYNPSASFSNSATLYYYYGGTKIGFTASISVGDLETQYASFTIYIYGDGTTSAQKSYAQTVNDEITGNNLAFVSPQTASTVDSTTSQDLVFKGSRSTSNVGPQAAIENLLIEVIK